MKNSGIDISAKAKEQLRSMRDSLNVPESYKIRLGMKGGGCGGMSYMIGFDQVRENDQEFDIDGLMVVIDQRHSMYLLGMEIDFKSGSDQSGFIFNNPKAKNTP